MINGDNFFKADPDLRVKEINKMLESKALPDIAKDLDIPYSTFLKEMTRGDYVYIKRENKYFKFIRDTNDKLTDKKEPHIDDYKEELLFLKRHLDVLKKLISNYEKGQFLVLDKQIYDSNAKFVNKNIKVNHLIYEQFTKLCENKFPHLKIQDLISQALLDFIYKYWTN